MRKLFLVAKYFAIQDKVEKIEMEHIYKALENLVILEQYESLVSKYIDADQKVIRAKQTELNEESLDFTKEHRKIDFSEEVKKLKNILESEGVNYNTVISNFVPYAVDKNKNILNLMQFDELKVKLKEMIFSQDIAIEVIVDKLVEISYKSNKESVKAIFFFSGPPATGKTYLAEALEKILDGYKLGIFDMTNYSSSNQGFALVGLSKGYTNAGEGKLTSFVKKNPKSICLFDEIEKAHPEIQNSLLQIMARGKGVDEYTQEEIDFSGSIFIFTSNLGSELYNNTSFLEKMKSDYSNAQSMILEAISREKYIVEGGEIPKLKPEFLSRVAQGDIILFNKLSLEGFYQVASKGYKEYIDSFREMFGVEVACDDLESFIKLQILTFAPIIDARRIKSKLAIKSFDVITDFLRQAQSKINLKQSLKVTIVVDKDVLEFLQTNLSKDDEQNTKFLHSLFRKNETVSIEQEIYHEGGEIKLIYKNPSIKKLPKSKDFSDEDGSLVFEIPDISFSQIAGHNKVKERLNEVISYLKNSQKLTEFNVKVPSGMLLYGSPGTGKTMLAKAFANEAGLPFISTTGTEILNINLMKKIYKRAREYAPSIVFIDEIDAIGFRDGSHRDIVINQFLTELNGFSDNPNEAVFTISATNLPQKIDPAIIRSGRIDLSVKVDKLDKEARGFFIDKILKNTHDANIQRDKLITFTAGMSGADLEKVKRESVLEMIRKGEKQLTEEILLEQINIIKYGERLTYKSLEKLVESTAYHEAGHAVISYILMPDVKIEQITVTPRNEALGFVSYNFEDTIANLTFEDIKNKVCVAFAGRISQIKKFGKKEGVDSGASSDLDMAMRYLYYAIATLGMDEGLGYINISSIEEKITKGGLGLKIEQRIQELIKELEKTTFELVEKEWDKIEKVAKVLIENEFIDENNFLNTIK